MLRRISVLMILTLVAACSADEQRGLTGEQAYKQTCASCHDDGIDGAPRTGDPDAWADRSMLWEAVLIEHANNGYLKMPAKGGDPSLDDATVARAVEYMLMLTYPDAPRD